MAEADQRVGVRSAANADRHAALAAPDPLADQVLGVDPSRSLDVPLGSLSRPSWRGRLHLGALWLAVPLFVTLITVVDGARTRVGVVVYAAGLCAMLAASTIYHRWVHTVRARSTWRRVDHAMIFAAIAGTCTPLCLILLETRAAVVFLVLTWFAAAVGALIKLTGYRRGNLVATAMYMTNGWAGMLLLPALWERGALASAALLMVGGAIYTVGAVGFSRQWPTLRPSVFSYHEVWHLCTLAAAGAHLTSVWLLAT